MDISLSNLEKIYTIEKELGRGGMGVVYLATDKRLDRRVAIKVLNIVSNSEASTAEIIQRFQREAKAVAKLAHPNIVNIHDIGDENNLYYMVMEFVDGKVTSDLSSGMPMDPSIVINIAVQICNALDFAHESGIIHRDIKPANIIFSKKGIAKLMDFGIAQLGGTEESYKLTQAGSVLGSIMYISPEQLNNASNVDARSDIYSLGISLYELLTGNLPFMSENISSIIMNILTKMPEPASTYNNKVSPELDAILNKALAKSPEDRYQSAAEMGRDLSKLLNEQNITTPDNINFLFGDDEIASFQNLLNDLPTFENKSTVFKSALSPEKSNFLNLTQNTLKKTFINEALIESLDKDFSWLKSYVGSWKLEETEETGLKNIINSLSDQYSRNLFTGALVIDNNIFIFIHENYFIGAINLQEHTFNEDIFHEFPDNPDTIELRSVSGENINAPAIIASMFNYEKPFYLNLDSSTVDLIPLIDNFSSENSPFSGYVKCYFESNIFYYGYSSGKQIFACCADEEDDTLSPESYKDLKSLISNQGILFNTYFIKPNIIGPTVAGVLKQVNLNLKYKEYTKSSLFNIAELGDEEIPNFLLKEVKQNVYLDLVLNQNNKLRIVDKDLDIKAFINDSIYYGFSNWLIDEYIYLLNTTNNTGSLKQIYSLIPGIESFKFFNELEDEDNNKHEFSIIINGKIKGEAINKILFLVQIGNGEKHEIEQFIESSTKIKKKYLKSGDIGAAFYVSYRKFTPDIQRLFSENTSEPKKGFLSGFDVTLKYKGFVRLGMNKGYHLNLIEWDEETNNFRVFAPAL